MHTREGYIQPQLWFNEVKHPAIILGPFTFPAYVQPILVAFAFILTRPHRRFLQRLNRNPFQLQPGVLNGVRNNEPGDFARQLQGLLALFHVFCTGRALSQGSQFYKDDLLGYACAEAVSLLIAGFYLDPAMLASYLATSAGWVLIAVDDRFYAAAALLALPCAWQLIGRTGLYHWQSGILLFQLSLDFAKNTFIDDFRDVVVYHVRFWGLAVYLSCLIIGGIINVVHQTGGRIDGPAFTDEIFAELVDFFSEAWSVTKRMLAVLSPLAIFGAITSYLSGCIGWRWIFVDKAATPPLSSWLAPVLFAFIFVMIWCLLNFFREPLTQEGKNVPMVLFQREAVLCADCMGMASTLMVLLWWALVILPHVHVVL